MATSSSAGAIPLGRISPAPRMPLAERLSSLIDEIAGLAAEAGAPERRILPAAQLATTPVPASGCADVPQSLADLARRLYTLRRRRARHLPAELFGEPACEILLDLFIAAEEGRLIPVTSACIAADVPGTTALRWLTLLESRGMVERRPDPRDGRRCHVALTVARYTAIASCLALEARGLGAG